MPVYNPQQLGYHLYTRSHEASRFETFERHDSFLCWIDLLGVQNMTHNQITTAIRRVLFSASESSATGGIISVNNNSYNLLSGTPNSAMQFSLIGDALVLVEKDQPETPAAATLGFFDRINLLSRFLFEEGYLHRGVVTRGSVKCEKFEDSSVITGRGLVDAVQKEKTLKAAGLFHDETVHNFILARQNQIDRKNFVVPFSQIPNWPSATHAPNLFGVSFSQYDGWTYWNNAVTRGQQNIPHVQNTIALLRNLKTVYNLP